MDDIIQRIEMFMHTSEEIRDMEIIIEMAMIVDDDMTLTEAFNIADLKAKGTSMLKKIGMGTHNTGDGLIQIALKSGKIMAEFIFHAIRAAGGNEKSVERVKELANTEVSKEQLMDLLLKLDMATLHLISGPLHAIDAWTGWHVWAHIKTATETGLSKAKKAIADLADAAKSASDEVKKKLKSLMHGIARLFGIDDLQNTIKAV